MPSRWKSVLPFALLTGLAVILMGGTEGKTAAGAAPFSSEITGEQPGPAECPANWQLVASPNPRTSNRLESVSALASNDVWAVGYFFDFAQTPDHTLAMHWNGTTWSHVPSPNPSAGSYLMDVEAITTDNVWAVGYAYIGYAHTLIEHWNGTAWSIVPSPNQGPSTNELTAIDAISADDIWAVGNTPGSHNTVTLHWNGSQWSVVPSLPNDFMNTYVLGDVSAVSSNDVWAVGYYYPESGAHRTVTIHWNGTTWRRISSPNPGAYVSRLFGSLAVSSNEVWAVGQASNDGGATYQTLILKWDGSQWSRVPSPSGSENGYSMLYSITRGADGELWAVGKYHPQNHPGSPSYSLILRWDGNSWQTVSSPNGNRANSDLYGVTADPAGNLWTVGRSYNGYNTAWDTLIARNECGPVTPTPTRVPTFVPTPSSTAVPSTNTATHTATIPPTHTVAPTATVPPETATPTVPPVTPTSTACTMEFSDVPPGQTFYRHVMCLACRGIVSGYQDGTFRPNDNVTRGQLAKIVSNSAGFGEPPPGQTFEDVPPTNSFYQWIERLAMRGYMTGYDCSGPGEPCISGRPYFRPFANATRGQTAKIVSNTAGYVEPPTGQSFEDVTSTHPFYAYVERLASRGIMGGYACGGAGEPCVSGRPYFRSGNDVTRGQSSKIVANTFFPSCGTP